MSRQTPLFPCLDTVFLAQERPWSASGQLAPAMIEPVLDGDRRGSGGGKGKGKAARETPATSTPTANAKASTSRTSQLLAAYDARHADESTSFFEVPASHFLARPTETAAGSASPPGTTESVHPATASAPQHAAGPSVSFTPSGGSHGERSRHTPHIAGASHDRASTTDLKSETSVSLGERDLGTSVPVHPLFATTPSAQPLMGGQQQRPHVPDTSTLAAADYDIDVRSGFLPPETPVSRLEGIEEEIWETALDRARAIPLRIGGGGVDVSCEERRQARQWRRDIRKMLVLHPSPQLADDIRYARRAHLVLAFLAHFYIHSQPDESAAAAARKQRGWISTWPRTLSADEQNEADEMQGKYQSTVPASLAIPWVALSRHLDLPPVLTYATTVLWNWTLRDPTLGFTDGNLAMATTFSGTESEQHFYKTSLLIEKRGVEALTWMRRTLDEAFVADSLSLRRIRHFLLRLARVIDDLARLLHDVRNGCDPSVFYWGIRPWFNGGDSGKDPRTNEQGWIYEGVDEYGGRRKVFNGPSAGQSSMIHSIDVFLGVDHAGRATSSASERENATFMERMQAYMPGHHRNFLTHLRNITFVDEVGEDWREKTEHVNDDMDVDAKEKAEKGPHQERHPLRSLLATLDDQNDEDVAMDSSEERARRSAVRKLQDAYNTTLTSLKHLRDEHMRIATLYIISQMRTKPPAAFAKLSDALTTTTTTTGAADPGAAREIKGAKGTGGTDLVSFLKDCRTNTVKTLYASVPTTTAAAPEKGKNTS